MKYKKIKIIWLILILATVLRLFKLGEVLPLYWEEAAIGYDAYSIMKTGKDYHGNIFPIIAFTSFGDYKPSLYFYSVVPFMAIMGPNEWAVRLPSALAGVLAVYLIYLISRELRIGDRVSLLAALILAISPWHLQFSRAGFEVNLGTTLFMVGIWLMLLSRKKPQMLTWAVVTMVLSTYAYHGFRILAPLMSLAVVIGYFKSFGPKRVLANALLAVFLMWPILTNINNPAVRQRYEETSHFSQSQAVLITNALRESYDNVWWSRVIYHRYWWWAGELLGNYFDQFNVNFLFIEGDGNNRHGTGEFGLLHHWELITVALGLAVVVRRKDLWPIVAWLVLAPVPAMLTKTTPHALRFLPVVGAMALISAMGLSRIWSSLEKRSMWGNLGLVGVVGLIVLEIMAYLHFYYGHYPVMAAGQWQYGYKEIVEYTESVKNEYEVIYFTRDYGRPSIYVLFYGQYDPIDVQLADKQVKKDQQELLELGKYKFGESVLGEGKALVVTNPDRAIDQEIIYSVDYPNGKEAFVVYEL